MNHTALLEGTDVNAHQAPTVAPDIVSTVEPPIHLSVTITITFLVGLLFLIVYVQLVMVLCFGYKLLSYQTLLLFNILLWAALRLTLYAFYFNYCCDAVNNLDIFWEWLLVSFPSVLQFFSLAILVHYFGENFYRVLERRQEISSLNPPYKKMRNYRIIGWLVWLSSVIVFFVGNVVFTVLIQWRKELGEKTYLLEFLRVLLLDGLFLIMGITLGICIIVIYTTRAGKDVLEAQRVNKCKPCFISFLLIAFFVSRAVYNFVALGAKKVEPYIATDMADNEFKTSFGYIAYFVVQVIWEVIPTYLIVFFFRVTFPSPSTLRSLATYSAANVSVNSENRKHFFDNPHRYDSETDSLIYGSSFQRSSQMAIPNFPTRTRITPSKAGYGSTTKHHYSAPSKYSINSTPHSSHMPGTTPPPLFTQSPSFFSDR